MFKILVDFEIGQKGLIAKKTSDHGAWVVPARYEKHFAAPSEGKFLVKIVGQSANESLRFCNVLASLPSLVDDLIRNGGVQHVDIMPDDTIYLAKKIAKGTPQYFLCLILEPNNSKFRVHVCDNLINLLHKQDVLCYWDSPLPPQELPPASKLAKEINEIRVKHLTEKQIAQQAQADKELEIRNLCELALEYPNETIFRPLLVFIKRAKQEAKKTGHKVLVRNEELGVFGKFSEDELQALVQALSENIVCVESLASGKNCSKSFYCRPTPEYLESQKEYFLRDHPDFAIAKNDINFWTQAVKQYGVYQSYSENYVGYGYHRGLYTYKLLVGDYYIFRNFSSGIGKEEIIIL